MRSPTEHLKMPDSRPFPQQLPMGALRYYYIDVPKGGSVAITVHPRQGHVTWNVTYQDVTVFRHPMFTHRLRAPYMPSRSRGRRSVSEDEAAELFSALESRAGRKKRSKVRGAVRHNFDYDVPELNAGLGQSLGPGSITYWKEDQGGRYIVDIRNRGASPAEYIIYATTRPHSSPFPRSVGDPQAKVEDVTRTGVTLEWMPIPEAPMGTQYCVFYHNARVHMRSDVHSSPYASHMTRPTTVKVGCTHMSHMQVLGLQPDQEYHLDVFSQSPLSKLFTPYLGVRTTTDHRSYARSGPLMQPGGAMEGNFNNLIGGLNPPPNGIVPDPAIPVPPVGRGAGPVDPRPDQGTRSVLEVDNPNNQGPAGAFSAATALTVAHLGVLVSVAMALLLV